MENPARPKLLCVDDEDSILHSLARLFKPTFDVLTAPGPHQALELLNEHRDCAVVLSDYVMPEMNGLDFLRRVRQSHPLTSRAVLSGQIDLPNVSAAINSADIHKFFLKPWENEYLTLQMLEALKLHQTLSERAHFERLALTDPVTSVGNHRYFQDQLKRALDQKPGALALVILDVDHFKRFNDQFGHPRGDQLLRKIAYELSSAAEGLGLVARYGGEEFTIILPDHGAKAARAFAEDARRRIEAMPERITLSAGLAIYPRAGRTPAQLIEAADQAMYRAKAEGRNRVVI